MPSPHLGVTPSMPACTVIAALTPSAPGPAFVQGDRSLDRILPRPYVQQWRDLEQQVGSPRPLAPPLHGSTPRRAVQWQAPACPCGAAKAAWRPRGANRWLYRQHRMPRTSLHACSVHSHRAWGWAYHLLCRACAAPPRPQHQERQRRQAEAAARQAAQAQRQRAAAKKQQPTAVIMTEDKRRCDAPRLALSTPCGAP